MRIPRAFLSLACLRRPEYHEAALQRTRVRGAAFASSTEAPYRVIFLRHGESTWNRDGRYIGWTDVPLTNKGEIEAWQAGEALSTSPYKAIDVVYTSFLKRAIKTAWLALEAMSMEYLPSISAWQLNERMYGLAGLTEAEAKKKYGGDRVDYWADSWDDPPPEVKAGSEVDPATDVSKYGPIIKDPSSRPLPRTESMKMTQERAAAYLKGVIKEDLKKRRKAAGGGTVTVLVASHANTIKCLMGHLDCMSPADMKAFEVPRAVPIVYDLDEKFKPLRKSAGGPSGLFVYPKAASEAEIRTRLASNS